MIPLHAPPYYFSGLSLMEYLQSFYCWYIGAFDNRKIQLIFHRLISFCEEDLLSTKSKKFLIEELNMLADGLRFSSITLSSFEKALLQLEERIIEDNPKAKLISLLSQMKSKEEITSFFPFLSCLDPKKLDRFMSQATLQLIGSYLKNTKSLKPLYELQSLFQSWNQI